MAGEVQERRYPWYTTSWYSLPAFNDQGFTEPETVSLYLRACDKFILHKFVQLVVETVEKLNIFFIFCVANHHIGSR